MVAWASKEGSQIREGRCEWKSGAIPIVAFTKEKASSKVLKKRASRQTVGPFVRLTQILEARSKTAFIFISFLTTASFITNNTLFDPHKRLVAAAPRATIEITNSLTLQKSLRASRHCHQ